jgi:hypothetical protein
MCVLTFTSTTLVCFFGWIYELFPILCPSICFVVPVWTSTQGYNHQEIGRKVSQIQAVLARRCAAVGELQQHLLRAGWHRGVAQWGGTWWCLTKILAFWIDRLLFFLHFFVDPLFLHCFDYNEICKCLFY